MPPRCMTAPVVVVVVAPLVADVVFAGVLVVVAVPLVADVVVAVVVVSVVAVVDVADVLLQLSPRKRAHDLWHRGRK